MITINNRTDQRFCPFSASRCYAFFFFHLFFIDWFHLVIHDYKPILLFKIVRPTSFLSLANLVFTFAAFTYAVTQIIQLASANTAFADNVHTLYVGRNLRKYSFHFNAIGNASHSRVSASPLPFAGTSTFEHLILFPVSFTDIYVYTNRTDFKTRDPSSGISKAINFQSVHYYPPYCQTSCWIYSSKRGPSALMSRINPASFPIGNPDGIQMPIYDTTVFPRCNRIMQQISIHFSCFPHFIKNPAQFLTERILSSS